MAKKESINIVTAWNWAIDQMTDNEISASEQLTLFWVMSRLNRNNWQPTKINIAIISALMRMDKRTVKKAMQGLIDKNIISESKGVYKIDINIGNQSRLAEDTGEQTAELARNHDERISKVPENSQPASKHYAEYFDDPKLNRESD